ncbi:MAG: flagellar hook-basal body complex protein FliE [Gemmatimonadota bacterium]|nr:flagellar hook-basal body complex protein FliE [Gemmatimonadota bacterium]
MQARIDLLTRSLDTFQTRDTGLKSVPVLPESDQSASFGNTLTKFLNEASDAGSTSADLTKRFTNGENVEMHQVMSAAEEAGLALDLVISLRDKAVDAYRTIISMQS